MIGLFAFVHHVDGSTTEFFREGEIYFGTGEEEGFWGGWLGGVLWLVRWVGRDGKGEKGSSGGVVEESAREIKRLTGKFLEMRFLEEGGMSKGAGCTDSFSG